MQYYKAVYQDGFDLECQTRKRVRETMGLTNVKLKIPFSRTENEAEKVIGAAEISRIIVQFSPPLK